MIAEIEVAGLTLDVEYTFKQGEDPDSDYPGSADSVELGSITLKGDDIWEIMSYGYIEDVKDLCLIEYKRHKKQ